MNKHILSALLGAASLITEIQQQTQKNPQHKKTSSPRMQSPGKIIYFSSICTEAQSAAKNPANPVAKIMYYLFCLDILT